MNDRILILRETVVTLTQMLSGKGIKVTQRGLSAYVECDKQGRPTLVNLPFLPDNAGEELCAAIHGFLDHEVAHILFSDFALIEEALKANCKGLFNILEDARIERCMAAKFSGCGHNLAVTGKFFLDKYIQPQLDKALAAADTNKIIGSLMSPLIRAMSGQFVFKEYMKDKMALVHPVFEKISDLEQRIAAASSSRDCLDLAKEIHGRIVPPTPPQPPQPPQPPSKPEKDEKEPEPESEPEKESGQGGEGEEPEDSEGDGGEESGNGDSNPSDDNPSEDGNEDESGKPNEDESSGDEDDAGEDEGGSEKSDGGSEEDKNEGGDSGESSGEAADSFGEGDDSAESADGSSEGEVEGGAQSSEPGEGDDSDNLPSEMETGNARAMLEAINADEANNFDQAMSILISNSAMESGAKSDYLIYTKEFDVVTPLRVGSQYAPRMFTDMADKVDHMVGPLQKDLERAISARSLATWEAGRRSGRLHSANLSRLAVGDNRVFRRRHETTSKDVAVELVIDASGSMQGSKIHLATQAAYALSSVLERLGIENEVIAFTTRDLSSSEYRAIQDEQRRIGRRFSRTEGLFIPIIKGFNERINTETRKRFGWLPNSSILTNNIDGESVEIAARRLLARRENGKVMIVLSDGAPNADGSVYDLYEHLRTTIKNVEKAGVKCVGIGIQSTEVERFYEKNIVIRRVDELPSRVVSELRHLLVG